MLVLTFCGMYNHPASPIISPLCVKLFFRRSSHPVGSSPYVAIRFTTPMQLRRSSSHKFIHTSTDVLTTLRNANHSDPCHRESPLSFITYTSGIGGRRIHTGGRQNNHRKYGKIALFCAIHFSSSLVSHQFSLFISVDPRISFLLVFCV